MVIATLVFHLFVARTNWSVVYHHAQAVPGIIQGVVGKNRDQTTNLLTEHAQRLRRISDQK